MSISKKQFNWVGLDKTRERKIKRKLKKGREEDEAKIRREWSSSSSNVRLRRKSKGLWDRRCVGHRICGGKQRQGFYFFFFFFLLVGSDLSAKICNFLRYNRNNSSIAGKETDMPCRRSEKKDTARAPESGESYRYWCPTRVDSGSRRRPSSWKLETSLLYN